MKQSIKKYLSGSLKHIVLTGVLGLSVHFSYADDITNTNNYLPNGKYRLFGSGRGEVQNIDNQIRLHGQLSQQAGNLHIQTSLYQGNLSYQQHFHNHGHREHSPFENKAQRNFSAKKGSIVQGGATLTDLSVTGYEIHPADAYDGEQGGGYPLPTGARDEYLYEVNGKEVSVKVVALDKLPNKTNDNQLLQKAGIDPAKYEQPQNNDERVQIERLTYTNNTSRNANNLFYSNLGELGRNGQGWNTVEIRQPEPLLNNSTVKKDSNDVSVNKHFVNPVIIVIPPPSTRFGGIIHHAKWIPYDPNTPIVVNRQFASPKPVEKSFPYERLAEIKLPFENDKKSQGNTANNNQNDYDNPSILGYYDDGDDSAHSDDEDYGYNYGYDDDDYYGGNHQNQQQPDTAENKNSFEDDILALRLSPPLTGYQGNDDNGTQSANNYPTNQTVEDDYDRLIEDFHNGTVGVAELSAALGSIATDILTSGKGRSDNSVDSTLKLALAGDEKAINNLEAASEITAAQANVLRKAATNKQIDDILKNTNKGRKTSGRATQYEKSGDFDSALNDFYSLNPTNVQKRDNGTITGTLPDGRNVNVRPQSSGKNNQGQASGYPTLEIQNGKNKTKIRYGDF